MKQILITILLLILLSIPASLDLFIPGAYSAHDITHHVIRTIDMDKILSEGFFPPRWSGHLNNEYGYPVFLFNYPLPAILAVGFHHLGLGYIDSTKAVFGLSIFLSTIGMFLFLRSYLGKENLLAAFLGSIFYLYAPIRFVNIYVSAQIGGSLALGILPFVFWCTSELLNTKKTKWALFGGIFLSLLILSHNVTTLLFLPVLSGFILMNSHFRIHDISNLKKILLMFLLGFGLSAWFWLPSIVEKQHIIYDQKMDHFWAEQFIEPWQLINSKWDYGFSLPKGEQDGMSFQIGYIHILVILLSGLWLLAKKDKKFLSNNLYWIGIFFVGVFLMLEISYLLWEYLPLLEYVQFQFRILALCIFASSVLVGLFLTKAPFKKLAFIFLLALVIYASRNNWHINQINQKEDKEFLAQKTTTAAFNEHLPKWGEVKKVEPKSKVEVIEGEGSIQITEDKSQKITAQLDLQAPSVIRINQFYFPGWRLEVGYPKAGYEDIEFNYLKGGDSYGLMVFSLPKGSYQMTAEFKETGIRQTANIVSILTLGGLFAYFLKFIRISK